MTDFEKTQLREDLMEQFHQMMADELPTGSQDFVSDAPSPEWAPKR